jgi:hypothetical protein
MQEQQSGSEQAMRQEVVLRLHPNELVPDDAQVELWRGYMAEQRHNYAHYCLGAVMASVEGTATAIDRGDPQSLMLHVRMGLAATAAYEQLRDAEQAGGSE